MSEPTDLLTVAKHNLPIELTQYDVSDKSVGLVIIDEVNGFCTVGAGNLAPAVPNTQVADMVARTDKIARTFADQRWPIIAALDTHEAGKPEPPYPPHCERGTGEENIVPQLAWLEDHPDATLIRKDCINFFVGAIEASYGGTHGTSHNRFVDWVNNHRLEALVTVGICTDICVMDFVLTTLSARNHGLMPTLKDIVVYEPACATYDLPLAATATLGLPRTAAHPQMAVHHLGLYFMASRGAILADRLAGV